MTDHVSQFTQRLFGVVRKSERPNHTRTYKVGFVDGLADVDANSTDPNYLSGYRRGQRALLQNERGVGPGWNDYLGAEAAA